MDLNSCTQNNSSPIAMMHQLMNDDQQLTDNIIARHFNQSPFSQSLSPQLPPRKHQEISNYQQLSTGRSQVDNTNSTSSSIINLKNYQNYNLDNQINQIEIDSNGVDQMNPNYESHQQNHYQFDPKEMILNRNDKIRDLINDCELINNNNINNFLLNNDAATITEHNQRALKIVSTDKCHCKCHCTGHKKKNPFHQIIKTNRLLLNSLSKIKMHSSSQKCSGSDRKSDSTEDSYNTFAPSLSNYSLSSSSSISSQTISVSSCSSTQDNYNQNNYNLSNNGSNSSATVQQQHQRPRKPPMPPPPLHSLITNDQKSFQKPPAKLPPSNESNNTIELLFNRTHNSFTNGDIFSKDTYERVITKSFENLLGIRTDDHDKRTTDETEESIYETIDNDYDQIDNYAECEENRNQDEEDLYQDIELLDEEDIYESLSNDVKKSSDSFNDQQNACNPPFTGAVYMNNQQSELDRKLMKQQKVLDKKRQLQNEKLRKRFGLSEQELIPLMTGIVKRNVKSNGLNLELNKDEVVLVLRIDNNPPGLWLAKNERGKIGYLDLNTIDVDLEVFKNLMKEPNVLKS